MGFLSFGFNKPKTTDIKREQLAGIVAPFIKGRDRSSSAAIAKGFSETAEWLRIGFDAETDKGSLYHALHHALTRIADAVAKTPDESVTVEIKNEYMEAIKSSYFQMEQASYYLQSMARQKMEHVPETVMDRHGNELQVPFTQIYNRPNEAHDLMGHKLEQVKDNLEQFVNAHRVKPASDRQIDSYRPVRR